MLERLKNLKWNLILASLLYLALGIALLIWPNTSNQILCTMIAVVLTAYGLFQIISFLNQHHNWFSLLVGVICAGVGVYSLLQPTFISGLVSSVLGFAIVVDGLVSLSRDLELRQLNFPKWWIPLLLDIIVVVLGIIIVFHPALLAVFVLQVTGVALIYESLSDLWTIHRLAVLTRAVAQTLEDASAIETSAVIEDAKSPDDKP